MNPLKPSPSLLAKLGLLTIYVDDLLEVGPGYYESLMCINQLMKEEEMVEWLRAMRNQALVPEKRK